MDHGTLSTLRDRHPAWRLLASPHAPLVASFLQRVFVAPNVRVMSAGRSGRGAGGRTVRAARAASARCLPEIGARLPQRLGRERQGLAAQVLQAGSDEAHFDLTPATEKAIAWLGDADRAQLRRHRVAPADLFELLKQMSEGSETDPQAHRRTAARSATRSTPRSRACWRVTCRCSTTRR
jgi:hypothetical protein